MAAVTNNVTIVPLQTEIDLTKSLSWFSKLVKFTMTAESFENHENKTKPIKKKILKVK